MYCLVSLYRNNITFVAILFFWPKIMLIWISYLFTSNSANSNRKHLIAFELYKPNNNSCKRRRDGLYTMEVGQFARAYVAQKTVDYNMAGKDYGDIDGLDYVECTGVYYNDVQVREPNERTDYLCVSPCYFVSSVLTVSSRSLFVFHWKYYAKLGCASTGGLRISTYSDEYCSHEINTNLGIYNDIKASHFFLLHCHKFASCSTIGLTKLIPILKDSIQHVPAMSDLAHYCWWWCRRKRVRR